MNDRDAVKVSMVQNEMVQLVREIERTGKIAEELDGRLSCVSSPQECCLDNKKEDEPPLVVPMAQSIQEMRKKLIGNNHQLENIISRIEI